MRFISLIETAAGWIAAVLLTLTGAMLTYEVVARYFFNAPTIWAAELSQLCLIWAVPVAAGWALSHRRHIRVNAVTNLMPFRARQAAEIFALLVVLVFSLVVIVYGWEIFFDSWERGRTTGTMLDMKAWIPEASVPAGFVLLALSCVACLVRAVQGDLGDDESHEVME